MRKSAEQGRGEKFKRVGGFTGRWQGGDETEVWLWKICVSSEGACEGHWLPRTVPVHSGVKRNS